VKTNTDTISATRFPFAFPALGLSPVQRDHYASKVQFGGPYFTPRQAASLAAGIRGGTPPRPRN